jgi:hypothetical protein
VPDKTLSNPPSNQQSFVAYLQLFVKILQFFVKNGRFSAFSVPGDNPGDNAVHSRAVRGRFRVGQGLIRGRSFGLFEESFGWRISRKHSIHSAVSKRL